MEFMYLIIIESHIFSDTDECGTDNGGCDQTCTNDEGTFECGCWTGFRLDADGSTCLSITSVTHNYISTQPRIHTH